MSGRRGFALSFGCAVAASTAMMAGCCSEPARRPNVIPAQLLRSDPRLAEGQRVFMANCNQCHVGGASGLGPSLSDKRLPPYLVRFQVRHGLGAMPKFGPNEINDAQLDDVVKYVRFLREHPADTLAG